jgi:hypothetical protein
MIFIHTESGLQPEVWLEPKHDYQLSEESQSQTTKSLLVCPVCVEILSLTIEVANEGTFSLLRMRRVTVGLEFA